MTEPPELTRPEDVPAWVMVAMPTVGPEGLDVADAQALLDEWGSVDPHMALALSWEAYSATVGGDVRSVGSVNTGAQSVSYNPPAPVGPGGAALARANYHRTRARIRSVPSGPSFADRSWDRLLEPQNPTPGDLRVAAARAGFTDKAVSEAVGYPVLTDVFPAVRVSRVQPQVDWRPIEPVGRAVGQLIEEQATGVELPQAADGSVAEVQYATPERAVVDGAR